MSKGYINWPVCCRDGFLRRVKFAVCNPMFLFISVFCCLTLRIALWGSSLSVVTDWFFSLLFIFSLGMLWKYSFLYTLQGFLMKSISSPIACDHKGFGSLTSNHVFSWDFTLVSYSHKSNTFLMGTYFWVNNLVHGQLQGDPESIWWVEELRGIRSSPSLTRQEILDEL